MGPKKDVSCWSYNVTHPRILCPIHNDSFASPASLLPTSPQMDLVKWVKRMSSQDRLVEVVDPRLLGCFLPDDVEYVLGIALRCVEANALKRPRMSQVVHMLESEDPKQVRGGRRSGGR